MEWTLLIFWLDQLPVGFDSLCWHDWKNGVMCFIQDSGIQRKL